MPESGASAESWRLYRVHSFRPEASHFSRSPLLSIKCSTCVLILGGVVFLIAVADRAQLAKAILLGREPVERESAHRATPTLNNEFYAWFGKSHAINRDGALVPSSTVASMAYPPKIRQFHFPAKQPFLLRRSAAASATRCIPTSTRMSHRLHALAPFISRSRSRSLKISTTFHRFGSPREGARCRGGNANRGEILQRHRVHR